MKQDFFSNKRENFCQFRTDVPLVFKLFELLEQVLQEIKKSWNQWENWNQIG